MSEHNQRTEYGNTLAALGAENESIVVLEADLGRSTMSCFFEERFPERYFEMGIAEQNMTSFAAGLALTGKIPFTNSFAVFAAGRPYDQIRQSICTANLPVKIVGSSAGLSDFGDGATHQAIEDLALMTALPNMTVLTPCDGPETCLAVRAAAQLPGPVYLRVSRNNLLDVYPIDQGYSIGQPVVLRPGKDITAFTIGSMAQEALEAAQLLDKEGIDLQVVHLPSLKPINEAEVRRLAQSTKGVVGCEEHSIYGGLNAALGLILRGSGIPHQVVAVQDCFGQSAHAHRELLAQYRLDSQAIVQTVRAMING